MNSGHEKLYLYLVLAVVFVAGLAFIAWGLNVDDAKWSWGKFLIDIGIAFLIASLVALAVERFLKERLFAEINDEISTGLAKFQTGALDLTRFGRLPSELQVAVRRQAIDVPIIQRDSKYVYHLSLASSGDEPRLKGQLQYSTTYVNTTGDWQTATVLAVLDDHGDGESPSTTFVRIDSNVIEGDSDLPASLTRETIRAHETIQPEQVHYSRPVRLSPHARVRVTFNADVAFESDDWTVPEASQPTVGLEVELHISGGTLNIAGDPADVLRDHWDVDELDDGMRFLVSGAILSGQGIEVRWSPD